MAAFSICRLSTKWLNEAIVQDPKIILEKMINVVTLIGYLTKSM